LKHRISQKAEALAGGSLVLKREEDFLKGMHVALPTRKDTRSRPPNIPNAILKGEEKKLNRPTLKQIQEEYGGAGVFNFPLQGINKNVYNSKIIIMNFKSIFFWKTPHGNMMLFLK